MTVETAADVRAGALLRPTWRRLRFWVGLGVAIVLGGLVVAAILPAPGRALDPGSPSKGGSKALAQVLRGFGTPVTRTTEVAVARGAGRQAAVLVASPDDYSTEQLRSLSAAAGRVVLVEPSTRTVAGLPGLTRAGADAQAAALPGCADPGALATGEVDFPVDTLTYRSTTGTACYGGAVILDGPVAVLGSSGLLRNDTLAHQGVAALDVNVLTADRTLDRVVWLLPGADAAGSGAPSVWQLFPPGAHRAFLWLLGVGLLIVLWRARRLGPPVTEPLPVVVRAAEVVEGHGRLYDRADARSRAAQLLRAGTLRRLAGAAGLPRTAGVDEVVAATAAFTGRDATAVRGLLAGSPPVDDAALVGLARQLQQLEEAAGRPSGTKGGA